ncbi:MAG: vacuolar iron transporter family protein [Chloroflexota bacterium]|nr:vacuolar iron transporter family protein [Chloroflexota bacterium]
MTTTLTAQQIEHLKTLQKEEINGHYTYAKLAKVVKDENNAAVIKRISGEEMKHYEVWKSYTGVNVKPNHFKVNLYFWIAKILGLTFGIRLMEQGEEKVQVIYRALVDSIPEAAQILDDEEKHEEELMGMLDEESLRYAGSVVLGLNDALVELTGALAGLTFAFKDSRTIALAGLVTGISAALSMAASDYLSNKADDDGKDPTRSAIYTGFTYLITVMILVAPYLLASNYIVSLVWTLVNAILVIALFNYYISVARGYDFKVRFFEMAAISMGVALLSFLLSNVISAWLGVKGA